MAFIEFKNLHTWFYTDAGIVKAVNGVDFEIRKGETVCVVGESGCGKSVTSLSLMHLVQSPPGKIVDGEILMDGRDLLKLSKSEMEHVNGKDVAMITLGDVSVYSTCTYVHNAVKNAGFELEIIPGITSFCAAADKAQISLCEGNESVAIIPSLKSNLLEKYIADFDTVVIMKSGNDTDVISDILKKYGLENNAIVSSCIGMENEVIEKIQKGKSYGYFTTVIVRK